MRVDLEEQPTRQVRREEGERQPERTAGDHQLRASRDELADRAGPIGAERYPDAGLATAASQGTPPQGRRSATDRLIELGGLTFTLRLPAIGSRRSPPWLLASACAVEEALASHLGRRGSVGWRALGAPHPRFKKGRSCCPQVPGRRCDRLLPRLNATTDDAMRSRRTITLPDVFATALRKHRTRQLEERLALVRAGVSRASSSRR